MVSDHDCLKSASYTPELWPCCKIGDISLDIEQKASTGAKGASRIPEDCVTARFMIVGGPKKQKVVLISTSFLGFEEGVG